MAVQRGGEQFGPQKSFVVEMRARREAAGLSRHRLAESLGCTPQWLAKVEHFDKSPSEGLADDLDTYFKTGGTFRRLWEQMLEVRRQGLISSGFRSLIDAEKQVSEISYYEPLLIPGLFQTIEYARLQISVGLRPEKVEELVGIRMDRQKLLERDDPPWLFLLIREAVIRDLPAEVKEGQCKRLLDLLELPKVSIQIVPTGAHVFLPTGFQVLRFEGGPDVAYVEGSGRNAQMLTDGSAVRRLAVLFSVTRSAALPGEETGGLVRTIMESA